MNIQELSSELLALKEEIKEIEERHALELDPKEALLTQLQTVFIDELTKLGLKSIKTDNGNFALASRTGFKFTNEIEAMKWAKENNAISIDRKLAGQVLKDLEKLPSFIEKVEQSYLTIKETTKK